MTEAPKVTKHQIAEYYSDPEVRSALLRQIRNKPVLAVQARPDKQFIRRNAPDGTPIRILQAVNDAKNKNDLAWYTDRRYSEFHPTIGKKTKQIWVDIDPGPGRTTESLKPVAVDVEHLLRKLPEVKKTQISYSGGRGFYVRGELKRKTDTNEARKRLEQHLEKAKLPGTVQRKPRGEEVRLDTSTLHNKGSIRADYSLNAATGRVAIPLTQRELRGFSPEQADVKRVLKEKEFAPGIPRSKRVYALPEAENKQWTLSVQQHDARRAGRHWDVRLVDPDTGFAHSWAVPRAAFPESKEKLLAVRTPTHTSNYALNFGAHQTETIGKGYGKGTVKIVHQEPVSVQTSGNNKVRFKRIIGEEQDDFTLFRTKDDMWLLRKNNSKPASMEKSAHARGYQDALASLGLLKEAEPSGEKLPASQLAKLLGDMERPDQRSIFRNVTTEKKNPIEERLNRDVQWSASREIPQYYMEGPSPILPGNF